MTTSTVPIRYYYSDGEEMIDDFVMLGDLVQIGDSLPKPTRDLTESERAAVVEDLDRLHPFDPETVRIATGIHKVTESWTDEEISDRLGIDPGDVPLFRSTPRFLSAVDVIVIAEQRGCKPSELWAELEGAGA